MSGLFGGNDSSSSTAPIPIPTPKPVAPMPDPTAPLVVEARRRRTAEIAQRSGRESTIMSDDRGSRQGRPLPMEAPLTSVTPVPVRDPIAEENERRRRIVLAQRASGQRVPERPVSRFGTFD